MNKFLRFLSFQLAPAHPKPTLDDLLTQAHKIAGFYIPNACSEATLLAVDASIANMVDMYAHLPQTAHHVDRLHTARLLRAAELLASWYPENEQA